MIAAAQITNPFPGLRPFEPHQADLFFGRDEQIEELLDRLQQRRFLAVVGTSGSGKSSLVRAGLIPTLQRGYFAEVGSHWRIAIFRPGSGPMVEFARSLVASFGLHDEENALSTLSRSSLGLLEFARKNLKEGESLLLVVDQFEELFRYQKGSADRSYAEESAAFVKLLLVATGHSELPLPGWDELPIYVILTMRSDFLGKCSQFRGLPEALNDSQYLVPRMTREQQSQAIEGPIGMAGARISPQLVQRLLNDVGDNPDQLPVLQHALMRTWEQSSDARARSVPIDVSDYGSSGEMKEALNIDAERTFAGLHGDEDRRLARRIFQRLVEPSAKDEETRRPTPLSEIVAVTGATEEKVRELIDVFRNQGFLTLSEDQDPIIDITHESLIRLWQRLNTWVKEEEESAKIYSRLADSAKRKRALYRDPELTEALRWKENEAPNAAWAGRYSPWGDSAFSDAMNFLERSRKEKERQQAARRRTFVLLTVGLIIVSVLSVLATLFWLKADRLRNEADEQGRIARGERLGTVANNLSKGPGKFNQRSLLLALESFRAFNYFENDRLLHQILSKSPIFVARLKHDDHVTTLRFISDGKLLLSGSKDKTARVWEVAGGKEIARLPDPYGVRDIFLSPDTRHIATTSGERHRDEKDRKKLIESPGAMRAWEWDGAKVGRMLVPEQSFTTPVQAAAFDTTNNRLLGADSSSFKAVHLDDPSKIDEIALAGGRYALLSDTAGYLATAFEDGSIHIIDVNSLRTVHIIQPIKVGDSKKQPPIFPKFLNDKLLVATSSRGIYFWNPVSGKQVAPTLNIGGIWMALSNNSELVAAFDNSDAGFFVSKVSNGKDLWKGETEGAEEGDSFPQILFSPDDTRLAVNGGDRVVRVYSVPDQLELFRISVDTQASKIAFSPDSESLAIGETDGTITVWRLQSGGEYRVDTSFPNFSPSGKFVEFDEPSQVRVLDRNDGHQIIQIPHSKDDYLRNGIFSQDDRYYARVDKDKSVHIYDLTQGHELSVIPPSDEVVEIQFNSPAHMLIVATRNGAVTKWNPVSGEQVGKFETGTVKEGDIFGPYGVIFSRDARICAVSINNNEYQLWDVERGSSLGKVQGQVFWGAHFSPDGRLFAVMTEQTNIAVWKTNPLKEVWHSSPTNRYTMEFDFSPDGQSLVALNNQDINIWDAATGQPSPTLKGESEVGNFAFTPDSKYLAATYQDNSTYIWSLQNSTPVSQIILEQSGSREVGFSPDGKFLIVQDSRKGAEDAFFRMLWWHPEDLINEACKRVSRNLTTSEWQQYLPTEAYRKTCPNLPY